jgi:hypothetical protein
MMGVESAESEASTIVFEEECETRKYLMQEEKQRGDTAFGTLESQGTSRYAWKQNLRRNNGGIWFQVRKIIIIKHSQRPHPPSL